MNSSKWLNVHSEQEQKLFTLPSCLSLCDLKSDNYFKLISADIQFDDIKVRPKLKIFKGTSLFSEQGLPGIPSAIKSFYVDEPEPKVPIIAVSVGPSVLFYRNMKPYYKYTLPGMAIEPLEIDVWRKLPIEKPANQNTLVDSLRTMEISTLTIQSQKLLNLLPEDRDNFIKEYAEVPLQKLSTITAMTTMQRTTSDSKPPSALILATENGEILIIDVQSFSIIYNAKVCSFETIPSNIAASGQFEIDFRIIIASRDGSLFLIRKSWLEGKEIIKMESPAIGLILLPIDQTIVTANMNNRLSCYSKKGKQLWSTDLQAIPLCITPVHLPHLGMTLIAVALANGFVKLYSQKVLVDEFNIESSVQSMIFGQLGQEEHCLILILDTGGLLVKILKRTAVFGDSDPHKYGPEKSDQQHNAKVDGKFMEPNDENKCKTLKIPKKNSVFLKQTMREKDNAKAIYSSSQVELWRLRLTAARASVETINSSENTISGDLNHPQIKLSAEICGVGPLFRIFLTIENMSTNNKPATHLLVLIHADLSHYTVPKPVTSLPTLIAGAPMRIDFEINAVLDENNLPPPDLTPDNSIIRVMILKKDQAKPLIAAVVSMPESEAPLEG